MARRKGSGSSKCAGRTSKGRLKKGYKVVKGRSCPVRVSGSSGGSRRTRRSSGKKKGRCVKWSKGRTRCMKRAG